jgi:fructose/tagatose bisphosphate aldolase
MARGRGEVASSWTTPAINLRALTFDCARAAFRSADKIKSALMIFEIARVELGWSDISLAEYSACVLAAAIAEGYRGPVFLQGDHFQISAQLPIEQEKSVIKRLVKQAVAAGFYNIDIDTSTLVDLSQPTVSEQQYRNASISAELAAYIRNAQPDGITISIGGEIGEVGGHVSTIEELSTYIRLFNQKYAELCPNKPGLSKVSIHSGSTHGGTVLADGKIRKAQIDFEAIEKLDRTSREVCGLGGVVQHGASTLAYENFDKLVQAGTLEVHLATSFMTTLFQLIPDPLRAEMYHWLDTNFVHERTKGMTDPQFYHKTQMHALAPFKKVLWNLPTEVMEKLSLTWESQFDQLFTRLGCTNTREMVENFTMPAVIPPNLEDLDDGAAESPDVDGLVG